MKQIENYFLNSPPKLSKTSLDEFKKFTAQAGNPFENFKIIHIAWTNGKGSVAQMLFSILKLAWYNVGLFTSPHLLDLRERIQTNQGCIKSHQLQKIVWKLKKIDPTNQLGFFEKLTLAAWLYFADQKVDFAIIETWLWWRLDPTNIVNKPAITTITSIWRDHMHILGNTLKKIAFEKAWIIKPSVPVVVNFQNKIIEQIAKDRWAPLIRVWDKKPTNLAWEHQQKNAALAYKIAQSLGIPKQTIRKWLMQVKNPWRLEYILPNLIVDWAHNLDGFQVLKKYLDEIQKNWENINLFVMLKANKNEKILKQVFPNLNWVVNLEHSFLDQKKLSQTLNLPLFAPEEILKKAQSNPKKLFVVFWSLYWLGEFLRQLQSHHLYEPSIHC